MLKLSSCARSLLTQAQVGHPQQKIYRQIVGYQLKNNVRDCYNLLNVTQENSDEEIRDAYLQLAKVYHPDSGTASADSRKFNQIQQAYQSIKNHRMSPETAEEEYDDESLEFDIKHTVPQHRQYLTYDGIGFGTPTQRQKQYRQHRIRKATEDLFEHKKSSFMAPSESALVHKTKYKARRNKMSNTIERVVEDLIQESMQKGEFDNLAGYGKPIDYKDRNSLLDATTYKINNLLKNEGFAPDWIMLEKEIRDNVKAARGRMAFTIEKIGRPPFNNPEHIKTWSTECERLHDKLTLTNQSVKKFNLIVPILNKQLIPYHTEKELERVLTNHRKFLLEDITDVGSSNSQLTSVEEGNNTDNFVHKMQWGEVWKQLKGIFTSSKASSLS